VLLSCTVQITGTIQDIGADHVVMSTGERIAVPPDLLSRANVVVGLMATISVKGADGQLVAWDIQRHVDRITF
jgi:hypothetical protein